MTREMLRYGEHTSQLKSLAIGHSALGDTLRSIAEATGTDDGILRIDVDVYYGSEVDVYAHQLTLACYFSAIRLDEV